MQRVGEVVRVAQGVAVARCPGEEYPDIGTSVLDEDLNDVGRIVDVFGPVERPYLAVATAEGIPPATLLGKPLYAR